MSGKAGIVARTDREEAISLADRIVEILLKEGYDVLLEPALAEIMHKPELSLQLDRMRVDVIVTIGGDGTILRTCLQIPKPEPPILAVDMGVRGFLTEVPPERAIEAVEKYLRGEYTIERCSKIASYIGDERLPDALNEVFVTSRHLAKILHVKVSMNDESVMSCRADGVIIASQVGSTGYALSAGGPIIDPGLEAFVLTPVCPITSIHPIVFPSSSTIKIEIVRPRTAVVVIDGQYQKMISEDEPSLTIRKSEHKSSFIRFDGSFYQRLKARLLFSREES